MSVDLNGTNLYTSTYGVTANQTTNTSKTSNAAEETAAAENKTANEDTFVKSTEEKSVTYKPDVDKINEMKNSINNKMGAFQQMVQTLFGKQIDFSSNVMQQLRDIISGANNEKPVNSAEDFFNDPEWGVEAVATRIVDFAKALSGGDPSKIELLTKAVEKGFAAAGAAWGGDLPEVSNKTYDRVKELFDEWANPKTEEAEKVLGE